MKLYHVAAISENHVIGVDQGIPWKISEDLRRFSKITKGHPIIMGSKTFKSMGSKPLPSRTNIVVGHADCIVFDGKPRTYDGEPHIRVVGEKATTIFVQSLEDAIASCAGDPEVYIIGGGSIYAQTMDLVDELRLTIVHQEIEENASCVYYPEIDEETWGVSFIEAGDTHSYVDYVRRSVGG